MMCRSHEGVTAPDCAEETFAVQKTTVCLVGRMGSILAPRAGGDSSSGWDRSRRPRSYRSIDLETLRLL